MFFYDLTIFYSSKTDTINCKYLELMKMYVKVFILYSQQRTLFQKVCLKMFFEIQNIFGTTVILIGEILLKNIWSHYIIRRVKTNSIKNRQKSVIIHFPHMYKV